ncbi:coiled-coil domain-containing protein 180-like [Pantherophis guttatus]|uniref:Coiled-coil domain-containing protein 180-like n=1 Tax=Pantherophis guttatus TaxID=94885 RepID=A0ABM3YWU3_PANGU|nr:coiled-coil domain-containing protein 180-like [Pantherophis guttatus]
MKLSWHSKHARQTRRVGLLQDLKKSEGSTEGRGEEGEITEESKEVEETEEAVEILLEKESEDGERDAEGTDPIEMEEADQEEEEEGEEMETPARQSDKHGVVGEDVEKSGQRSTSGAKTQDATKPDLTKDSGKESKRKDVIVEFFTTSNGNTYKVVEYLKKSKLRKAEKYYQGKLKSSSMPSYLEQVYLSEAFFRDIRRHIRLQFFEHLEKWFDDTLSSIGVVVVAKKEELNSELQLRLHLHEPRRERIEKDIYNVRRAELRIHSDRLKRHCAGLIEALNKERSAFIKIREDHNAVSKSFRTRIQDMEKVFQMESRAERVMALSRNLHMELLNHVEVLQVSMRSYRQYLEEALGKLRDSNTDFLKACRLFADGGNFSPEELEIFMKQLQKENSRIEFVEGLIMIDMEKAETGYLEQATEIISKFENRFRYLAMDRVFLEKIQRFLTNIQVKIKTEVAKSNWQTQTLNNYLEKLVQRIDACAHPNVDKGRWV